MSFKNYLKESKEFNDFDIGLFSDYYNLNKNTYNNKKTTYNVKSEYKDELGDKWLYVKKHDFTTIALAVIDGMCDKNDGTVSNNLYKNIKNKQDLDNITMNNPKARRLINYVWMKFTEIIKKGKMKVYRGFNIPATEYEGLNLKNRLGMNLLDSLNNTNKKYNSFTYDLGVAKSFATGNALGSRRLKEDTYAIIIKGEADLSDINFAHTAYLIGLHGNMNECELNINNFKEIRNLDIYSVHKIKYENGKYIEL